MPVIDRKTLKQLMKERKITQVSLVERSGVSRAQIGGILRGERISVRDKTISDIASAIGVDAKDLEQGGAENSFRDWIIEQHSYVSFRGLQIPLLKKELIEDVFVPPNGAIEKRAKECPSSVEQLNDCSSGDEWAEFERTRKTAESIVEEKSRVVVVGHPGDGKTTFLRKFCKDLAAGNKSSEFVPVYYPLPYSSRNPNANLLELICSFHPSEHQEFLREKIEQGQCWLFLDGLDEVSNDDKRQSLLKSIAQLLRDFPNNKFVVSSRIVGFDRQPWVEEEFSIVGLQDFELTQVDCFAEKWAKVLHRIYDHPNSKDERTVEVIKRSLLKTILSSAPIQSLTGNPMILTILAALNESGGGNLPRRRVDLYEKIADVFLVSWERSKRTEKIDRTFDLELDSREFEWLLASVALAMQRDRKTLAPKWWLRETISDFLVRHLGFDGVEAKDIGENVLRYLTQRTGFIEERGLNEFGFLHRTLQEYFAATGIVNESSTTKTVPELLRYHVFDPSWNEVIRLTAAKVPPLVAQQLITVILDDLDPIGRFVNRGEILALQCMSDGTRMPSREKTASLFKSCETTGHSRWLGVTIDLFEELREFGKTRIEPIAKRTIEAALTNAKVSLSKREYEILEFNSDPKFQQERFEEMAEMGDELPITGDLVNLRLFSEDPDCWWDRFKAFLFDSSKPTDEKVKLVRFATFFSESSQISIPTLSKIAKGNFEDELRCASVTALAEIAPTEYQSQLIKYAKSKTEPGDFRATCINGLANDIDDQVTKMLLGFWHSESEPEAVRRASLRAIASNNLDEWVDELIEIAADESSDFLLRRTCLWLLDESLSKVEVRSLMESLIAKKNQLSPFAAKVFIEFVCDNPTFWDEQMVDSSAQLVMNMERPCVHFLYTLRQLATSRFLRGATDSANVLGNALSGLVDKIEIAFVFGSTVRNEQDVESDIDLFLMGDITLKDLSKPLREAEDRLGRDVNPVVYKSKAFVEKYGRGDPFLTDVVKREKKVIFPVGKDSEEVKCELRELAQG